MNIHQALSLSSPVAIGTALGEAHASLGAAVARKQAAVRRWRDSLLQDDLRESIAARAELSAATVEIERVEALVERLGMNLSNQSPRDAAPHPRSADCPAGTRPR